jgi:23S rRNA (adenine2503-C2)-methyltransferase
MTGAMGFGKNLNADQILNQILCIQQNMPLTNIVFMGMGEPLDNWNEVRQALNVITAKWGMGWSPQRITLSTIGIGNKLIEFMEQSMCHLAVSVHSPFAHERALLVPMQKAHPIEDTINIIRRYDWRGQRRVSFEYILFDGINDSIRHAAALAGLLKGLECRINLMRYHQIHKGNLRPSPNDAVAAFQMYLRKKGMIATLRASRGQDISAACGMLAANMK